MTSPSSTERACESGQRCNSKPSEKVMPLSPDVVRDRILTGNAKRKTMKRGVARRLLGNIKSIVKAVMMVSVVSLVAGLECFSQRPDVLEVFGGQAEVSYRFGRWGWHAVEPTDVKYGCDLFDED